MLTIFFVLLLPANAYCSNVEFIGEPIRWNPVDTSTTYTQKITISGENLSLIVQCGAGKIGANLGSLSETSNVSYGEEVFTKVCGKNQEPIVVNENQGMKIRPNELENPVLKSEMNKIEKALINSKFKVKFYSECSTSNNPTDRVVCTMFFPEILNDMRYVHEIEAFTRNMVISVASRNTVSFEVYAVMKDRGDKEAALRVKQSQVKGNYIPVCAFMYSKEFDQLYPIW